MEWSTVRRNVEYAAWAHGVADADIAQRADESLERVGLLDRRGSRARSLSGGMRPRLGLACALAHSPELTTLDEPTVGLDPVQRAELRHQIAEHGREGVVVVVAQFRQSMPAWAVLAGWIGVCVARVHHSSRHRARRLDRRCRLQHTAGRAGLTGGLGCVRRDPPRHSHRVLRRPGPLSRPGAAARLRDQRHPAAQSAVLRHGFELHVVPLDSTAGHHLGDEYRVLPAPVLHLGDCGGHRGRGRPRRGESRRKQKGSARHLLVPVTAGSLGDHRYDHASPRPARHRERRPMHRPPRIPPLPLSQRRTRQTIRRRKRRRHRGSAPRMRAMPSITFTQEYEPAVESTYFIDRLSTSRTNWIQVVYRNSEGLYIGATCGPSEAIESDSIKQSLFHRVGETRGPEAPRGLRDRRVRIVAQRRRTGAAGIPTSRRPSLHRVVRAHQSQFFDCTISKKDLP